MPTDHLSKSENKCRVVRSLWLQEHQSTDAGPFLHCILSPTWGSVGTSTAASVLPPPSPNLDPLRKTAKSPGSSHKAPEGTYRVIKLQFLEQPCDFSSSLPQPTSAGLERALLKLNLVLYFLIRLDLAYCVCGKPHHRGSFICVIVCTWQLTRLYSSVRDGSLVTS